MQKKLKLFIKNILDASAVNSQISDRIIDFITLDRNTPVYIRYKDMEPPMGYMEMAMALLAKSFQDTKGNEIVIRNSILSHPFISTVRSAVGESRFDYYFNVLPDMDKCYLDTVTLVLEDGDEYSKLINDDDLFTYQFFTNLFVSELKLSIIPLDDKDKNKRYEINLLSKNYFTDKEKAVQSLIKTFVEKTNEEADERIFYLKENYKSYLEGLMYDFENTILEKDENDENTLEGFLKALYGK